MIPAGFMATISTIIYQILQVDGFIMVYQPTARAGPGSHRVPSGPRAARPVFTNTDHGHERAPWMPWSLAGSRDAGMYITMSLPKKTEQLVSSELKLNSGL